MADGIPEPRLIALAGQIELKSGGQFSRRERWPDRYAIYWPELAGTEGVVWPKLAALMDVCGNDAPVLWMCHSRGYDLHAMRKQESETQRENRLLREENTALRRVLQGGR